MNTRDPTSWESHLIAYSKVFLGIWAVGVFAGIATRGLEGLTAAPRLAEGILVMTLPFAIARYLIHVKVGRFPGCVPLVRVVGVLMVTLLLALIVSILANAVDGDLWDWLKAVLMIVISIPLAAWGLWLLVRGK